MFTYDILSTRKIRKKVRIKTPIDLHEYIKRYARSRQEYFLVISLNGAHDIIAIHISTIGLINKTIVHPREVFKHVIKDEAAAIVVAHNHPSGNVRPSSEDDDITKRLEEAAAILGINFLDHLIINKNSYYSYRQEKKLRDYTELSKSF